MTVTNIQNPKNPLIQILVKKSMKLIASNSNVENTCLNLMVLIAPPTAYAL
jgi:hypothetical protein